MMVEHFHTKNKNRRRDEWMIGNKFYSQNDACNEIESRMFMRFQSRKFSKRIKNAFVLSNITYCVNKRAAIKIKPGLTGLVMGKWKSLFYERFQTFKLILADLFVSYAF